MSEAGSTAIFRPRLAGIGVQAFFVLLLVYFGLLWISPTLEPIASYPFGVAGLAGLVVFLGKVLGTYRRQGLRLDEHAIVDITDGRRLPYAQVEAVRISVEDVPLGDRMHKVRVATVEGGGVTLRFADLGAGLPGRLGDIVNIDAAGLLLATLAARTGSEPLYPAAWTEGGDRSEPRAEEAAAPAPRSRFKGATPWSFLALLIKVVPKFGAMALKLLKSVKPMAAVATVGAYSLIISWRFAVAFLFLIGVHECGHVFAMWRSGVKVKGIYFIPFFGGVAVGEGPARSAARSAYIAINGPVWGGLLALGCYALFVGTGEQWGFIGALAAWGALLNLFNLLPIMPLDGGRILAAIGASRAWGLPLIFASLLLGAALAYLAQFELLVLMVLLGLMEFGTTVRTAQSGPSLALIGERTYGADEHEHFSSLVAPVSKGRKTERQVVQRARQFEHHVAVARQAPMSPSQIVATGAGYLVLCGGLIALMWSLRDLSGAGNPLQFLR